MVAKAMKEESEKVLSELGENPNKVFKLVKEMKKDRRGVEGGKCMRGRDGN